MTAPNTAPITGRMKPSARIVFFPDSGLSLRLPLDMRDSTLTDGAGRAAEDREHRRRVERPGADRDDRGRDRREHEERQHAEQVLELRLALGRLAVVRLRLRELAFERRDLRRVRAERLVGLAGDDVELALVERAEQRRDHAEDHPHADLARLRREELERLVVQVEAVEEDLLRLPVRGVAERRLDVDRRARGRRRVEEVHAAAVPGLAPFPVPAVGQRRVLVERMRLLGRQQVPDPLRRRALDRRLGHALGRAGRVADVGEDGGDADVPAEVRGDDALARLGERVEQAGEDRP